MWAVEAGGNGPAGRRVGGLRPRRGDLTRTLALVAFAIALLGGLSVLVPNVW